MKKLMGIALGLALITGATNVTFAANDDKKEKKEHKEEKKDEHKKDEKKKGH